MRLSKGTRHAAQRGFSLVEIMVVISIIGLMAAIVGVNVMKQRGKANQTKVRADCDALGKAIISYKLDTNQYPNTLDDLLQGSAEGWDGPYINGGAKALKDPWKVPYIYEYTGQGDPPYRLGSYGADKTPQGDGDNKDIFPTDQN